MIIEVVVISPRSHKIEELIEMADKFIGKPFYDENKKVIGTISETYVNETGLVGRVNILPEFEYKFETANSKLFGVSLGYKKDFI